MVYVYRGVGILFLEFTSATLHITVFAILHGYVCNSIYIIQADAIAGHIVDSDKISYIFLMYKCMYITEQKYTVIHSKHPFCMFGYIE